VKNSGTRHLCLKVKQSLHVHRVYTYLGNAEMWAALRACVTHVENGDFTMAQAILDACNITLPDGKPTYLYIIQHHQILSGTLRVAYDERGIRYDIPIYCLSKPINLKKSTIHMIERLKKPETSSVQMVAPTTSSDSLICRCMQNSSNDDDAKDTSSDVNEHMIALKVRHARDGQVRTWSG
jgi:hypothetical protein